MRGHLSSVEISEWAAGMRSPAAEAHMHECAECRRAIARFQEALSDFRAAVREWGRGPAPLLPDQLRRPHAVPPLRWALIAAVLVLSAVIPVYRHHQRPPKSDTGLEDAVLLEQIDDGVSRSVPAPMEPLTTLLSSGSAPARQAQQKKH